MRVALTLTIRWGKRQHSAVGPSVFPATPAFKHTKCREGCGRPIQVDEMIVAEADGFRHLSCRLNRDTDYL